MRAETIEYMKRVREMNDKDLFSEMDSISRIRNGFSTTSVISGMAGNAQIRYNVVAAEIMKRELWAEYNQLENNICD